MYVPLQWLVSLSTLVATAHAATHPVEVDLIFPRNDTYSPTYDFPVVFAVQNSQHAELLNIHLRYQISWGDFRNNYTDWWTDLMWANWSSADPYFTFAFFNRNRTDFWHRMRWRSRRIGFVILLLVGYSGGWSMIKRGAPESMQCKDRSRDLTDGSFRERIRCYAAEQAEGLAMRAIRR